MKNIGIELILLSALGSVFVLDFLIKGLKRPSKQKNQITPFEEISESKNSSNKYLKYLKERPRNIGLYLFLICVLKISIHYLAFPDYLSYRFRKVNAPILNFVENTFIWDTDNPITYFLMWTISVGITSFIVWQLNPLIKKR